jgi:5-methylcytosine-specific restriction endonuclease McrA
MIKTIKHGINLIRHHLRDVGLSAKRSGQWPTVEKHFLEEHPACAACGGTERLNVHHIKPFHVFPELELDPNNLITLCMMIGREDHLMIGHGGSFKQWVPDVRKYAAEVLADPSKYNAVVKLAFANRKIN